MGEIAERLGIELRMVEEWRNDFEKVKTSTVTIPENATVEVLGKKINEGYFGRFKYHTITHSIETIRDLVHGIANRKEEDIVSDIMKEMVRQAKSYLKFIDDDTFELNIKIFNGQVIEYSAEVENSSEKELSSFVDFYRNLIGAANFVSDESVVIENSSIDIFVDIFSTLPFCIKQIGIVNFQDIHNCIIKDIPIDSKWIFVIGENGYGKTSLLQSISLGLFGWQDGDKNLLENAYTKIGVEFINDDVNIVNNLWTPDFRPIEPLACYGPSRLQIQSKMSQNEVAEKSTTTYGLFNPDGILLNIESKLIEWSIEENVRFEQVKSLFKEVVPYLADIIIRKNKQDDYEVLYVERAEDDDTAMFEPVPFEKLAAGFRSIIGLIGDLLIRFIRKQPDVKQLSDLAGIVLIDELENHLHPKWQYQLPTLLSKAFPNIQFIAATHRVIPILGAPKNSVFLKLNRSEEKGITVERIDIDVANLLPNSILTSPIFDMDTIRAIANEDVGQLRTEATYDEVVANDEIDKQLRELDNDPSQYPALLQE